MPLFLVEPLKERLSVLAKLCTGCTGKHGILITRDLMIFEGTSIYCMTVDS